VVQGFVMPETVTATGSIEQCRKRKSQGTSISFSDIAWIFPLAGLSQITSLESGN
jgi:hypothetical protein